MEAERKIYTEDTHKFKEKYEKLKNVVINIKS